jgi:hypothetical protein
MRRRTSSSGSQRRPPSLLHAQSAPLPAPIPSQTPSHFSAIATFDPDSILAEHVHSQTQQLTSKTLPPSPEVPQIPPKSPRRGSRASHSRSHSDALMDDTLKAWKGAALTPEQLPTTRFEGFHPRPQTQPRLPAPAAPQTDSIRTAPVEPPQVLRQPAPAPLPLTAEEKINRPILTPREGMTPEAMMDKLNRPIFSPRREQERSREEQWVMETAVS